MPVKPAPKPVPSNATSASPAAASPAGPAAASSATAAPAVPAPKVATARAAGMPAAAPVSARQGQRSGTAKPLPVAAAIVARSAAAAPTPSSPSLSPALLSPDQRRNLVMAGFVGQMARAPVSPAYRLGILLTALFMILLPIVYVGLICLVGLAIYWHLTNNHVILGQVRGRASVIAFLIYLAPAFIGSVMVLFMIKPLFAAAAREPRRRSVTMHSDPLLFDFVERICQLVGAPMPRRIDIDCEINAAASFRRGWLSVLLGRDLVLTIGMPLAAGLTLQQFAGVLAHEFGHFSQGTGMRLTYVIRSINAWFVRCVYERDSWDDWLAGATDELDVRLAVVVYAARAGVWLTRRVLWGLMFLGHVVAGFLLRQMEFDADRYETRLAGSQTFAETCRRLRLLGLAWQKTQHDMGEHYSEGRLADNLPKLLLANARQLPADAHKFLAELIDKSSTSWFDSHPADKDRIAAAAAEQAPGAFRSQLPASILFDNFDAAGKNVTWDFYCAAFGQMVQARSLFPTDELRARQGQAEAADEARDRYFAGGFSSLRALRLPVMPAGRTHAAAIWREELAQARRALESGAPAYRAALASFTKADKRLVQARQARALYMSDVGLQKDHFEDPPASGAEATRQRDRTMAELARLDQSLVPHEETLGRRLRGGLILLSDPELAGRIPDAEPWRRDIAAILPILSQIASNHASILELRTNNAVLAALLGHLDGHERHEPLIREIIDCSRRVREELSALRGLFAHTEYPFDHAGGQVTVSQFLLKSIPQPDEVGEIFHAADQLLGNLMSLGARAQSRLCTIAEAVEAALGYQPLPAPPAKESS
ncbi:MAG: M48 family metalloprotease [Planctomycetaceae bacterium]|nr:M48 family metalloprotease [Planctomycetaceae bacterium]